jgi:signal transduction histidine kinase
VSIARVTSSLEKGLVYLQKKDTVFHDQTEQWIIVGIPVEQSTMAGLFLFAPKQFISEGVQQIQNMILLSGLGAGLLAIGFTWILSRRMVHPLLSMKEAAQALSKGDFQVKIPVKGKDEIAQLGESINRLASDLYRLQTSRREFLSNVSHELRTPLSYIKGYSQALDEGMLKTKEDEKKYLKVLRQEADRLTRLVEDLFDLTQMDEGKLRLSKEPVKIDEVIRKMIHATEPKANAKNITLSYHPYTPSPVIRGDYGRLSQVLFNLLDNAIRHTPNGGKIMVETEMHEEYVRISIDDNGSGIPKEQLSYVWERFYRVDPSRAKESGGTGLGLAIVKQIIEGHQGFVDITSESGEGTRVTITLPISRTEKR